jgi:hypothetical protein
MDHHVKNIGFGAVKTVRKKHLLYFGHPTIQVGPYYNLVRYLVPSVARWVKIRIRDKHPGSGINIPDPQHCWYRYLP